MKKTQAPLLVTKHLKTSFKINDHYYQALDDVNLTVNPDEFLAIVGESGCGKSTFANTIMGLLDEHDSKVSGSAVFEGQELTKLTETGYDEIRGLKLSMIFQDPLSALNPLKRIANQIDEVMAYHTDLSKTERYQRVLKLLAEVGIHDPKRTARQFPHQLSGGMRQRVMIAMAVACKPDLIIADEPTTALDVTIQAQILDLLRRVQQENHTSIILITHDLGVVAETADRVAVMYAGQIVESGSVQQIFKEPQHPYTRSLLRSIPQIDNATDDLYVIQGNVPSLQKMPAAGDRFAPRIPWIPASAHEDLPVMHDLGDGHQVRCTCYRQFYFKEDQRA
ncbi:ABC transporter ATP-binding protein [Fructilactobacillus florum]|uniref:Oligopeptide transport ATP-binding protein oppD n=1 Tax=Fructilactobacillus florum DSM 22689 = JCM 16035 TaxID=1423745 RepID=A0A0R2CEQ5_9LACO|nr:ABC transporter ATP-binding protein [Fructilactobacillus florum]KRM90221.1 oligopeptide transport ATP-binding protein oppD [Fructilactobacillus florum DSM 22689 = JCM 16035]